MTGCLNFMKTLEKCAESDLTLTRSLTQVIGPAVPGLVLVGKPGIEGRSAGLKFAVYFFLNGFSSAVRAPRTDDQYKWKKIGRLLS